MHDVYASVCAARVYVYIYICNFFFFGKSEYEKKGIDCSFSDRTKKETPLVLLETKKNSHDKTANIDGDSAECERAHVYVCVCARAFRENFARKSAISAFGARERCSRGLYVRNEREKNHWRTLFVACGLLCRTVFHYSLFRSNRIGATDWLVVSHHRDYR